MAPALTAEAANQADTFAGHSQPNTNNTHIRRTLSLPGLGIITSSPAGTTCEEEEHSIRLTLSLSSDQFGGEESPKASVNVNGHHQSLNNHLNLPSKASIVRIKPRFTPSLKDTSQLSNNNTNTNTNNNNTNNNNKQVTSRLIAVVNHNHNNHHNNNHITLNVRERGLMTQSSADISDLTMNKPIANGHENCLLPPSNTFNNGNCVSSSSPPQPVTTNIPMTITSSNNTNSISTLQTTMGLMGGNNNKDNNIAQHFLLLKGKPENGQTRLDLNNIQWTSESDTNNQQLNNELSKIDEQQIIDEIVNQEVMKSQEMTNICETSTHDHQHENNIGQDINKLVRPESDGGVCELSQNEQHQQQSQQHHVNQQQQQQLNVIETEMMMEESKMKCSQQEQHQLKQLDLNTSHSSIYERTERLMKRLRRLQYKQTFRHISRQMKQFVEQEQNMSGVSCQRQSSSHNQDHQTNDNLINSNLTASNIMKINSFSNQSQQQASSFQDRMKLLTPEGVKGLSTSALVNLVKRLESSGGMLSEDNNSHHGLAPSTMESSVLPIRSENTNVTTTISTSIVQGHEPQRVHALDSQDACTSTNINTTHEESTLIKLLQKSPDSNSQMTLNSEEIEPTSSTMGTFSANLKHIENGYDSDETASSSGGESCDEFEDYNSSYINSSYTSHCNSFIPIHKRSSWKWAIDRGAIASRWTWLQAQVADLEFKIRQQNEMYRQLRATKGVISFGAMNDHNNSVPVNVMRVSNTNVNMNINNNNSTTTGLVNARVQQSVESDSHCVRTMPLNHMRKRKLVRSMGALSGATRKAAKYSTVQCNCNGLPDIVSPCVLCNGRYSYVQVIDTDCMPHFERVALLDSSCHPVLSLSNDVSLGLHFCELLKRETIQKPLAARQTSKKRKSPPSPTHASKSYIYDSKKSAKRSQALISSAKLRKKYDVTTKRKYTRRNSSGESVYRKRGRPRERSTSSERTDSPIPSPAPSDNNNCVGLFGASLNRRRRSEQHAYDINNIVIPYSIAASTRVEKLQYKEILTPKWRATEISEESKLNINNIIKSEPSEIKEIPPTLEKTLDEVDMLIEDITDKAILERHDKCELEEKKRILAFLKGSSQQGVRRGARVRFDSGRAESVCSGDGMTNLDTNSQDSVTTPPVTPNMSFTIEENHTTPAIPHHQHTPAITTSERKRSLSSSKRDDSLDKIDEDNNVTQYEETHVNPYEPRTFPISELDFEVMLNQSSHLQTNEDLEVELDEDVTASVSGLGIGLCVDTCAERSIDGTITANNSRAVSPTRSDATSIADDREVDKEDPEWEPEDGKIE